VTAMGNGSKPSQRALSTATGMQAFPPGSVIERPGNTPHFHWAKSGEDITQVTAIGPLGLVKGALMKTSTRLALSAALAVATINASAQDLPSSRRSISYHTVDIQGLKIFYREAGPADAPTVLLLHGFPSSSRMWEPLLPLLADKYHLIAPDYPGFGNSSAPPP